MDTPTLPLNRHDRRALRYRLAAPTGATVARHVTKANEIAQTPVVIVAAGTHKLARITSAMLQGEIDYIDHKMLVGAI